MLYTKQIEVKYTTDVLVVGGDAAGAAAAAMAVEKGGEVCEICARKLQKSILPMVLICVTS